MIKLYEVYVKKEATYYIEAESEEEALDIADEWLNERTFDDYEIIKKVLDK
jgi:hypothetical protein